MNCVSVRVLCVFCSNQSINLYFRHMAQKKVEKTDGKYLQQIYVYKTKNWLQNAKKCTINRCTQHNDHGVVTCFSFVWLFVWDTEDDDDDDAVAEGLRVDDVNTDCKRIVSSESTCSHLWHHPLQKPARSLHVPGSDMYGTRRLSLVVHARNISQFTKLSVCFSFPVFLEKWVYSGHSPCGAVTYSLIASAADTVITFMPRFRSASWVNGTV